MWQKPQGPVHYPGDCPGHFVRQLFFSYYQETLQTITHTIAQLQESLLNYPNQQKSLYQANFHALPYHLFQYPDRRIYLGYAKHVLMERLHPNTETGY